MLLTKNCESIIFKIAGAKKMKGSKIMKSSARKVADCRLMPSEKNCSLTIAGTEDEVLRVAVMHAVNDHGHKDTPELKEQVKSMLQNE